MRERTTDKVEEKEGLESSSLDLWFVFLGRHLSTCDPPPSSTVQALAFCLRRWYMLGVLLLLVFLVQDATARILWVPGMEGVRAQTGPRYMLSSERVVGSGVRTYNKLQRSNPLNRTAPWRVGPCSYIAYDSLPHQYYQLNNAGEELFVGWLIA